MEQIDYVYKTEPYAHQHEAFMISRDEPNFALLMEMGTGKSKVIIDTAAYQYARGNINCLLIVAPNGVHRNWTNKEIPIHLPDYVQHVSGYWNSRARVAEKRALDQMFALPSHVMRIIAINVDAFQTDKGRKFARKVLNSFATLMCIDESSDIKTPGATRTMAIVNMGIHAKMRRIATGTPITQGPFDLYSQFGFLSKDIIGFSTAASFRAHFGEYETIDLRVPRQTKRGMQTSFENLVGYRNLDELTDAIRPYTYRKRKKDCLDLPDKIYMDPYPVKMTTEQRRLYEDAKTEVVVYLKKQEVPDLFSPDMSDDELLDAITGLGTKTKIENGLTKLLRMRQIIGGFFTDEAGTVHRVHKKENPRIAALMQLLSETESKVIIWSCFVPEIEEIRDAISEKYGRKSVVMYYGDVSDDAREEAKERFQGERTVDNPDGSKSIVPIPEEEQARFFVANPAAGGRGLTLTAGSYVIYYSNSYSLDFRLQSEDRAHRIGQDRSVIYVDLEAEDSLDSSVRNVLYSKESLADTVLDML